MITRYEVTHSEIDSAGSATYPDAFTLQSNYTEHTKGRIRANSVNNFIQLDFGYLSNSVVLHLRSDYPLTIRRNGSNTDENNVYEILQKGGVTSLQYKNNTGNVATIEWDIYN